MKFKTLVEKENLVKISELHNSYFEQIWKPEDIEKMCKIENYSFFLAEDENFLAAFIIWYDTGDSVDLFEIAVAEDYRHKGTGSRLFEEAVRNIKKDIILEVREDNDKAILFYKKLNFFEISRRKNYYKNNKDAIIMVRKYV